MSGALPAARYVLFVRVHSADKMQLSNSFETYCTLQLGEPSPDAAMQEQHTKVAISNQKETAVWNQKFEIPVRNPQKEILRIRVISQFQILQQSVSVGGCGIALKQLRLGQTVDQAFPLLQGSSHVGAIRLQLMVRETPAIAVPVAKRVVVAACEEAVQSKKQTPPPAQKQPQQQQKQAPSNQEKLLALERARVRMEQQEAEQKRKQLEQEQQFALQKKRIQDQMAKLRRQEEEEETQRLLHAREMMLKEKKEKKKKSSVDNQSAGRGGEDSRRSTGSLGKQIKQVVHDALPSDSESESSQGVDDDEDEELDTEDEEEMARVIARLSMQLKKKKKKTKAQDQAAGEAKWEVKEKRPAMVIHHHHNGSDASESDSDEEEWQKSQQPQRYGHSSSSPALPVTARAMPGKKSKSQGDIIKPGHAVRIVQPQQKPASKAGGSRAQVKRELQQKPNVVVIHHHYESSSESESESEEEQPKPQQQQPQQRVAMQPVAAKSQPSASLSFGQVCQAAVSVASLLSQDEIDLGTIPVAMKAFKSLVPIGQYVGQQLQDGQ